MQIVNSTHLDVLASAYMMNVGDKLARHAHDVEHTCHVLMGAVEVEIYDGRPVFLLYSRNRDFSQTVLPPDIDHEIRAVLPNTLILNMMHKDGKYIDPKK